MGESQSAVLRNSVVVSRSTLDRFADHDLSVHHRRHAPCGHSKSIGNVGIYFEMFRRHGNRAQDHCRGIVGTPRKGTTCQRQRHCPDRLYRLAAARGVARLRTAAPTTRQGSLQSYVYEIEFRSMMGQDLVIEYARTEPIRSRSIRGPFLVHSRSHALDHLLLGIKRRRRILSFTECVDRTRSRRYGARVDGKEMLVSLPNPSSLASIRCSVHRRPSCRSTSSPRLPSSCPPPCLFP